MTEQTYPVYFQSLGVELNDTDMIRAPCCGRKKPVFSIRSRPTPLPELAASSYGFLCDSCVVERVRAATAIIDALSALVNTDSNWELVRHERTLRLTWTDQFDIERVREKINSTKLQEIDEYRQWLRDITTEYSDPHEALAAIVARAIPS